MTEVMEIVKGVACNQLEGGFELEELLNEGILQVLEAMERKGKLENAEIATIAKRAIINFKLAEKNPVAIPKGSLNYLRKSGRCGGKVNIEEIENNYRGSRRSQENRKVIRFSVRRILEKARIDFRERYLLQKLMEGATVNQAWKELKEEEMWDGGLDSAYDVVKGWKSRLARAFGG